MNDIHRLSQLKDSSRSTFPDKTTLFEINKKNKYKYLLNILLKKNSINREKKYSQLNKS